MNKKKFVENYENLYCQQARAGEGELNENNSNKTCRMGSLENSEEVSFPTQRNELSPSDDLFRSVIQMSMNRLERVFSLILTGKHLLSKKVQG